MLLEYPPRTAPRVAFALDAGGMWHDVLAVSDVEGIWYLDKKIHDFPVIWVKFTTAGDALPWPEDSVRFPYEGNPIAGSLSGEMTRRGLDSKAWLVDSAWDPAARTLEATVVLGDSEDFETRREVFEAAAQLGAEQDVTLLCFVRSVTLTEVTE